jgi:hypothetical protein
VPYDYLNVKFLRSSSLQDLLGLHQFYYKSEVFVQGLGKGYDEVGIHVQEKLWADVDV